jgi:hypothetical protein
MLSISRSDSDQRRLSASSRINTSQLFTQLPQSKRTPSRLAALVVTAYNSSDTKNNNAGTKIKTKGNSKRRSNNSSNSNNINNESASDGGEVAIGSDSGSTDYSRSLHSAVSEQALICKITGLIAHLLLSLSSSLTKITSTGPSTTSKNTATEQGELELAAKSAYEQLFRTANEAARGELRSAVLLDHDERGGTAVPKLVRTLSDISGLSNGSASGEASDDESDDDSGASSSSARPLRRHASAHDLSASERVSFFVEHVCCIIHSFIHSFTRSFVHAPAPTQSEVAPTSRSARKKNRGTWLDDSPKYRRRPSSERRTTDSDDNKSEHIDINNAGDNNSNNDSDNGDDNEELRTARRRRKTKPSAAMLRPSSFAGSKRDNSIRRSTSAAYVVALVIVVCCVSHST